MNKLLLILFFIFVLLFSSCSSQVKIENQEENLPTEENFLKILNSNKDGQDYLENFKNTSVIKFMLIKPEDFDLLKNSTQYKDLYVNLPEKELFYVEFNGGSSLSLMTIIDLEEQKVEKIFGLYLMGMG